MTGWVIRYLGTIQGRILTGAAALVAAANLARPDNFWPPQWEAVTAFCAALAAWLLAEFQGSATPYPHDVALFTKITRLIEDGERDFLRNHDFHASFPRRRMEGSREIRLWEGSRHEFLDKALQKRWGPLKVQFDAFGDLVAVSTSPDREATDHQTVHPYGHDRSDPNERVREEIAALNKAASDLIRAFDAFETYGRKRLSV